MAVNVFLDTSVLLAGLIDFGPQSARAVAHARRVRAAGRRCGHRVALLLEFFSVATRLPPEFRIRRSTRRRCCRKSLRAHGRHDLPGDRLRMLQTAARDAIAGSHLRFTHRRDRCATGAAVIVTDNRRHFVSAALRMRVETPRGVPRKPQEIRLRAGRYPCDKTAPCHETRKPAPRDQGTHAGSVTDDAEQGHLCRDR